MTCLHLGFRRIMGHRVETGLEGREMDTEAQESHCKMQSLKALYLVADLCFALCWLGDSGPVNLSEPQFL